MGEMRDIENNPTDGISIELMDGDMEKVLAFVDGPPSTPYEGIPMCLWMQRLTV